MNSKFNIKPNFISVLIFIILFSCQEKENIISSYSLNKADGIYKFKEKPFTGKVLDTTNSGRVILTFNCIKGKLNGKHLEYYRENGNLKQKSTYENGNKTGSYLRLAKSGDTLSYGNFLDYKKNGVWKEFYSNGNLKSTGEYQNNLQNGEWKYYFNNGKLKATGKYKDGDMSDVGATEIPKRGRIGLWKFYFEITGKLRQESEFVNGLVSGKLIQYHENGNISFKGNFLNQKEHGTIQVFDENGNLEYEEIYKDGQKIVKKEK